jgi:dipeptidyl aminopeptidase/acylaminoacyl peptidase
MRHHVVHPAGLFACLLACCLLAPPVHAAPPAAASASAPANFTLEQVLAYPFPTGLVAARDGAHLAWVINLRGARNVWVADGPEFKPRQLTHFAADDGQEITQLTFSPSGRTLVFVRGGDHDANWPAADDLPPDPAATPGQPEVRIWAVSLPNGKPVDVVAGDAPALSAQGQLAYIKQGQVWTAPLIAESQRKHNGGDKHPPQRLFFDRGKDGDLHWSPDGKRLAFVSDRDDHAFIGIYTDARTPLLYLAPSTSRDGSPRWSPDGTRIAFTRQPGIGGAPQPLLDLTPQPWSIWTADTTSGQAQAVWQSPHTLLGSYPQTAGGANLHWAADAHSAMARLVFLADLDGWPHLYSLDAHGGSPLLLTPGQFMVENVTPSRDRRSMIYSANTGTTADDHARRHLFKVAVDSVQPVALTHGDELQWTPVSAGDRHIAFINAGAQRPPAVAVVGTDGTGQHALQPELLPAAFPSAQLVVPKAVSFTAADGTVVHGQLFQRDASGPARPGVISVHGGPPRQMLLGWHYMDYYSNTYAVNQYLANHGFTVLSVNYRLGIGYGHAFHNPPHAGPAGAAEYQDVVAGAKFLQRTAGVDPARIGIWGGSYGGYLTALALARNSDIFKAGVDLHGVHDWSRFVDLDIGKVIERYEQGDRKQALQVAWESSPDADIAHWTSPVLLIQGDDDRNVHFLQTIDLARRLQQQGVPFSELVLPNEIHGFLRHASWLQADQATVDFLHTKLLEHPR